MYINALSSDRENSKIVQNVVHINDRVAEKSAYDNEDLKLEIGNLKTENSSLKNYNDNLNDKNKKLESSNIKLNEARKELELKNNEINNRNKELEEKIDSLSKQLKEKQSKKTKKVEYILRSLDFIWKYGKE